MDDEPLSEWADRRDAKIGRLRAVPIVSGDTPGGSHLNPKAPRTIERWNGHVWEPYGFASNLAEAQRILYPEAQVVQTLGPVMQPLGTGKGRHRKPPKRQ